MYLRDYLKELSPDEKKALAARAGTEVIYLIQIAGSHSTPSPKMAVRIEGATDGKVTRYELRPDVFGEPPVQSQQVQAPASDSAPVELRRVGRVPVAGTEPVTERRTAPAPTAPRGQRRLQGSGGAR